MKILENFKKVGILCCSNGQPLHTRSQLEKLTNILHNFGIDTEFSRYLYQNNSVFSGTAKERAEALMGFYRDPSIDAVFDISGGDIANQILDELDYTVIAERNKPFWGYSDLTTVINGLYAKTGVESVLYQVKNLVFQEKTDLTSLFDVSYEFIQSSQMEGVVVGGNIRCFLKLAGTPYFPDMHGKLLLLEAYGGTVPQMTTYLSQLKQMGVFQQISGIILGTFTKMEETKSKPTMDTLILQYVDKSMPVAQTKEIGHAVDSKAIVIGKRMKLTANPMGQM